MKLTSKRLFRLPDRAVQDRTYEHYEDVLDCLRKGLDLDRWGALSPRRRQNLTNKVCLRLKAIGFIEGRSGWEVLVELLEMNAWAAELAEKSAPGWRDSPGLQIREVPCILPEFVREEALREDYTHLFFLLQVGTNGQVFGQMASDQRQEITRMVCEFLRHIADVQQRHPLAVLGELVELNPVLREAS